MTWNEYVREIIEVVQNFPNAVIVGVSGCYYTRETNNLRVYINGGRVFDIPLTQKSFQYGESYCEKPGRYLTDTEIKRIKIIEDEVKDEPFAFAKEDYKLLKEYFGYMSKATEIKYGTLKTGRNGSRKERAYQVLLYAKLVRTPRNDMAFVDFEFQTIAEMNYSLDHVKRNPRSGLHCGKPDFIAINRSGFIIVELKTNGNACNGDAGLREHNEDFKKLIPINEENRILVRELRRRLSITYEYNLIHRDWKEAARNILQMREEDIHIAVKYLFITNPDFSEEACRKEIKEKGLSEDECIIVEA